jgi:NAD(P)H-nitrite reductase large subunit
MGPGQAPPVSLPVKDLFPDSAENPIWNEHRESTRGRDLDITGLSYAMLDAAPAAMALKRRANRPERRLYEDGLFPTPDGRARFAAVTYRPWPNRATRATRFRLTTGRLRDQWHGMSRTGTLGRLFGHVAEPAVQLHPQDMARRGLKDGDLVHVTSRRGSIVLPVQAPVEVADAAKQRGRQVCTCFNVTDIAISGCLADCRGSDDARLAALQASLKCGTNCGSCIPELKRFVRKAPPLQAAA